MSTIFRIVNRASNLNLRADIIGDPIFVSGTSETPDDHEQWRVDPDPQTPNRVYITNVGLNVKTNIASQGNTVITSTEGANFLIYPIGGSNNATDPVQIQIPNSNLIWTVETPNGGVSSMSTDLPCLCSHVNVSTSSGVPPEEWTILPVK